MGQELVNEMALVPWISKELIKCTALINERYKPITTNALIFISQTSSTGRIFLIELEYAILDITIHLYNM